MVAGPPSCYLCIKGGPVLPALTEEQLQAQIVECLRRSTLAINRHGHHQLHTTSAYGQGIPLIDKISILSRVLNTTARRRCFLPCYSGRRSKIVSAEECEWALLETVKQLQVRKIEGKLLLLNQTPGWTVEMACETVGVSQVQICPTNNDT